MNTRLKTSIAAGAAALMLAGAAPLVLGGSSAEATAAGQDQPQAQERQERRRGPGFGGPMRRGPGMEFRGLDLSDDQLPSEVVSGGLSGSIVEHAFYDPEGALLRA